MKTIADLFLKYLPQLVKASRSVPDVINYVSELKETLKQEVEWSEGEEAEFLRKVDAITNQEHWKPEESK